MLLSLLVLVLAWSTGFFTLPPREPEKEFSGINTFVAFAVYFLFGMFVLPAFFLFIHYLVYHQINIAEGSPELILATLLQYFGIALALIAYIYYLGPDARKVLFGANGVLGVGRAAKDFCVGMLTWLVMYPVIAFALVVLAITVVYGFQGVLVDQDVLKFMKMTQAYRSLFELMFFVVAVVVPFLEELLFRGFLQGWLKQKFSLFSAIVLTSIVFACCHFSSEQADSNYVLIPALFIFSCFAGFIKERQQSIWASVGLHATFNFMSSLQSSFTP